jgi:hypothetical protein
VTRQVLAAIEGHFPHLHPDRIERRFPPWDVIDLENEAKVFQ